MRAVPSPCRRTGVGTGSSRNRSSSGNTAKTACTIAFATRGKRKVVGESNDSPPKRRPHPERLKRSPGTIAPLAWADAAGPPPPAGGGVGGGGWEGGGVCGVV